MGHARGEVDLILRRRWMGRALRSGNRAFGVLVVQSYHEDVRFGNG